MIYGFAYLGMVLAISAGWIIIAVIKKPDFIEKPIEELKNKIRPFLNPKDDLWDFFLILSFLVELNLKIYLINSLPIFGGVYTEKKLANTQLAKKYRVPTEKKSF